MATANHSSWGDRYGVMLMVALGAYAIAGKGFAYAGVAPLYITEIVLAAGLLAMVQSGCMLASLANVPSILLAALMGLTLARTLPFVPAYGFDAVRDSVIIMYGLFAFIVAALLLRQPERLAATLGFLRWFTTVYVFIGPTVYLVNSFNLLESLPKWPGADTPILFIRGGELGVHLAGCAVLALTGLRKARPIWICALFLGALLVASQSRGGFLAILAPVAVALPFTRVWRRAIVVVMAGAVILGLAYAADLQLPTSRRDDSQAGERALGARQAVDNLLSLVVTAENTQLDNTKMFRVLWWKRIREYTLEGDYFWTGKGFGVNLAVDDGFVVGDRRAAPLRSPHNSHMTVLARTGVPGLVLWGLFLASWFGTVFACAVRAWRRGDEAWGNLLLFVSCYWLSNLVNASFDVALEGPMLGVWFWCQTGFGLGAVAIYRAAAGLPAREASSLQNERAGGSIPAAT